MQDDTFLYLFLIIFDRSELSEVFTDSFHDFVILHSRKVKYLKNRPRSQEIIRYFGVTQNKI